MHTLTESEAGAVGAVTPAGGSLAAPAGAAVERGHVTSLAVVDAALRAAAKLADGRREHHLDPLGAARLSVS